MKNESWSPYLALWRISSAANSSPIFFESWLAKSAFPLTKSLSSPSQGQKGAKGEGVNNEYSYLASVHGIVGPPGPPGPKVREDIVRVNLKIARSLCDVLRIH